MAGRAYVLATRNPSVSAALGRYGDGRLARADLSAPASAAMRGCLTPAELPHAAESAPVPRRATNTSLPLLGAASAPRWRSQRWSASAQVRDGILENVTPPSGKLNIENVTLGRHHAPEAPTR
jgi:hypothetical protein